ncbi:LysR family transcriptional regulator [Nocardioides panacisoli]|uniref:LysR family transcriptional regulator n=1 Tax=Nocardioides panacisoli TaxID=627624 RepID=UPI001C62D0EE|nr:LysR family transcriptional regulator [Nocardioides panacisoli]QYJ02504.1 LysR family transcriptional regulator [Nocardioides panacisoli]
MLLRQLEYLTSLAREQHFGRAAVACHVSQPALSAGIRKLEAELDVQIVQRSQRFEGFTAEGEAVLSWALRILAEREDLDRTLSQMRGGLSGMLRIGAIPTALTLAPLLTTPMRERYPGVRFHLASMSSREIVERLNDYDIEVGMTYVDGEPLGGVRVVPLYRERYLFLTPDDGALADRAEVGWAEAAGTPLCLLLPVMQNRRILERNFAEAGASVAPVLETDTVSALYSHVTSMGLSSIIPHAWLHAFGLPPGTRAVPLAPAARSHQVGLVLPRHDRDSLLARALLATAAEVDIPATLIATLRREVPAAITAADQPIEN